MLVALGAICLLPGSALAGVPAWTTYHHDGARTGVDPDSTSPVTPTQAWQSLALDGALYGEPVVYGSRVYVATENDTVYALAAGSGAIVWQRHLGTPVDQSVIPCGGDIQPVGITSTPVIDPSTGRIYVVADTWDGSNAASVEHELYALNLSDGSVAVGPVPVDPPGSTHTDQLQRTSLALNAGKVLIGFGGNSGDCGNYHGWLVAVREDGTGLLQTFEVDSQPGDSQGAIWGSGNAPAIDSAGNVWISTGNGNESGSGNFDFSESVIKLDSNLNMLDWWAPSDWASLDSSDTDLGSSMPVLLPGGLVFEIGKQGVGILLDASNLGHTGAAPVYSASVCPGSWGGGIYYNGVIYVTCSDGMHALKLDTTNGSFTALSTWTVDPNAVGPPIEAAGLIWAGGANTGPVNSGFLYALDPSTGAERFTANVTGQETFATPSAAGGLLFVANQTASSGDQVTAFRIANTPPPSPTSTALSSNANPAATGAAVTFTATVAPTPDAGTVRFTQGGVTIPGCASVALSSAGQARCTVTFARHGAQFIGASYSGDAYYGASSAALNETITPPPPRISHLRVRVDRGKLRIKLTLSQQAKLIVVIAKRLPGRKVHRRCVVSAKHGRRCVVSQQKRRLRLHGSAGRDSFKLRMRALPPGRYAITITAVAPTGARSKPATVIVVVSLS